MKHFFFRLIPPRPSFATDATPAERSLMQAHAGYWKGLLGQGNAIVFGLVGDPAGAYGIGVIELPDEGDPHALAAGDPTIQANAGFRMEILPMPMGAVYRVVD